LDRSGMLWITQRNERRTRNESGTTKNGGEANGKEARR
jgi:hypothetical protein